MKNLSEIQEAVGGLWRSSLLGSTVGPIACSVVLLFATLVFAYSKAQYLWNSNSLLEQPSRPKNSNRKKVHQSDSWTPGQFTFPPIKPCLSEISDIKPIPYRPFRWGEYHITMGIRSMPWEEWIELDNQFVTYHRIRAHRIKTRGTGAICVLPGNPGVVESGAAAAVEVVHELAEYLSRRYPTTFEVSRHPSNIPKDTGANYGWNRAQPIKTITIIPLNVSYDLPLSATDPGSAEKALEVAALITQDDLALMIEGSDGRYYFQAGAICVPGFWRMQDKIGLPLDEIHITGDVPKYKEKLDLSMRRFFQRLSVEKPVVRNNYSVQFLEPRKPGSVSINSEATCGSGNDEEIDTEELAWSTSANGPEDSFTYGGHRVRGPGTNRRPTPAIVNLRMRSERQTLRRLPQSGAILFTIRTYLTPIENLSKEPGVPGRLASALRGWGPDVSIYKGKERGTWWDVLLRYLDSCYDGQLAQGILEGERKERYPL